MADNVSLRKVLTSDLAVFFEHQLDPDATRMASFPPRQREEFMAHWAKVMTGAEATVRTIVVGGRVAGYVVAWDQNRQPKVGYWLGRKFWGQRIASTALAQFLLQVTLRPLYAHVAESNVASIRVLQKCGFTVERQDTVTGIDGAPGEELILTLGPN